MTPTARFSQALAFASDLHAAQRRKGTTIPYIAHLLAVAVIVMEHGGDEDAAIAAVFHDAAEDHGGTMMLERIRVLFGERVASIVEHCSDFLGQGEEKGPWQPRKAAYQAALRSYDDMRVLLVSAADKLDNARATLRDVREQGESAWERFSVGRSEQMWNYDELLTIYAEKLGEVPIVAELRRVLAELHGTEPLRPS